MIDKKALSDDLTKAFIGYQHRLDCPMPIPHETEEMLILKYRTDPIFHAKVESLVSGVMRIVGEHLDGEPVAGGPLHPSQVRALRRNVKRNCPPEIYVLLDQAIAAP